MKAHAAQEQVVLQGLVALQSLATHVDGKKALVAAQGADMATMALRTHTRPDVLSAALGTLLSLASGGAGHAQALMKTRGLAAALLGLSATAPPPQVAEQLAQVLGLLEVGRSEETRQLTGADGKIALGQNRAGAEALAVLAPGGKQRRACSDRLSSAQSRSPETRSPEGAHAAACARGCVMAAH